MRVFREISHLLCVNSKMLRAFVTAFDKCPDTTDYYMNDRRVNEQLSQPLFESHNGNATKECPRFMQKINGVLKYVPLPEKDLPTKGGVYIDADPRRYLRVDALLCLYARITDPHNVFTNREEDRVKAAYDSRRFALKYPDGR